MKNKTFYIITIILLVIALLLSRTCNNRENPVVTQYIVTTDTVQTVAHDTIRETDTIVFDATIYDTIAIRDTVTELDTIIQSYTQVDTVNTIDTLYATIIETDTVINTDTIEAKKAAFLFGGGLGVSYKRKPPVPYLMVGIRFKKNYFINTIAPSGVGLGYIREF